MPTDCRSWLLLLIIVAPCDDRRVGAESKPLRRTISFVKHFVKDFIGEVTMHLRAKYEAQKVYVQDILLLHFQINVYTL